MIVERLILTKPSLGRAIVDACGDLLNFSLHITTKHGRTGTDMKKTATRVVTTQPRRPTSATRAAEAALIANYRATTTRGRRALDALAAALLVHDRPRPRRRAMTTPRRTRIAPGVYQDAYGFGVWASVGSGTRRVTAKEERFPPGTPLRDNDRGVASAKSRACHHEADAGGAGHTRGRC